MKNKKRLRKKFFFNYLTIDHDFALAFFVHLHLKNEHLYKVLENSY